MDIVAKKVMNFVAKESDIFNSLKEWEKKDSIWEGLYAS